MTTYRTISLRPEERADIDGCIESFRAKHDAVRAAVAELAVERDDLLQQLDPVLERVLKAISGSSQRWKDSAAGEHWSIWARELEILRDEIDGLDIEPPDEPDVLARLSQFPDQPEVS